LPPAGEGWKLWNPTLFHQNLRAYEAPSGRELASVCETEGARECLIFLHGKTLSIYDRKTIRAGSFHHFVVPLPLGGRLFSPLFCIDIDRFHNSVRCSADRRGRRSLQITHIFANTKIDFTILYVVPRTVGDAGPYKLSIFLQIHRSIPQICTLIRGRQVASPTFIRIFANTKIDSTGVDLFSFLYKTPTKSFCGAFFKKRPFPPPFGSFFGSFFSKKEQPPSPLHRDKQKRARGLFF